MAESYEDLAYDLRQKYAEIVGIHLEKVTEARIDQDYPEYWRALENLYVVVKHKFKEARVEDEDDPDDKKKKKDIERYKELRTTCINVLNKHADTYLGDDDTPANVASVELALRDVEMFLYSVMDKANMFGRSGYVGGL